ncbi:type IX secretion system sortase PorU [Pontibacter silvestris]|uniref:Type IX secretion system sortase PorU n=1 Tax=Pontibacter silvestris TaxID=2305183 RepID=A0ABW4WWW4_9BACT|nr:type IX secretion system sortase PorU [Pontibacter silvestris]MCC9136326.1 type IX secretion system sortase PorU [Pontibacter silvestris]
MKWSFRLVGVCILFTCNLLISGVKAQSTSPVVTLNWQEKQAVLPAQNLPGEIASFTGATVDYTKRLPYYRFRIPSVHIGSLQLTQTTYAPFSQEEQKLFGSSSFGSSPTVSIVNGTENKLPLSLVTILPIRLNPQTNQLEKLVKFSYTYSLRRTQTVNARVTNASDFGNSSVLNSGDWYKIAITSTGVHKLDKATLQALGISTQNLDPKQIQLYGNGGEMLPQPNNSPRPDDLLENAVMVPGEEDGRFDDADYVLFYAQGPHTWAYDSNEGQFKHTYNFYTDTAYYFLRIGYANGKRVTSRGQAGGATQTINSYNERAFYERDLKNMVYSGREWYGEEFSSFTSSRGFTFPVSDIVLGSDLKLKAFLMANSPASCTFTLQLNNQPLGSQGIAGRGTYSYHPEGINNIRIYTVSQQVLGAPSECKVNIAFNTGGSSTSLGYLNYLELNYNRQLKLYGEQTSFRSVSSTTLPVNTFTISEAPASAIVWDVTAPAQPVQQETVTTGSGLSFTTATDMLREFVVFQNAGISLRPVPLGKVPNQNLHSLNQNGNLDFVVVTHPEFLTEANRLAAYRSSHNNLAVSVVTTQQIFNEFSSGAQDVTAIRDFMRMLYNRSHKSGDDMMYLLLFGDTSYDYKNRTIDNTNFVPIYESRESLHPINSYSSEDYFGFLDEDEGEWTENTLGDHLLDVGIGRLPVKTNAEAAAIVQKIMSYDSPSQFGKWRSQVTFVADDGDYNEHMNDAEYLANYLVSSFPGYNPNKLYLDLYPQEAVSRGKRSPEASSALDKAITQGSLITNFTGHGNEISWTAEQILTMQQIANWQNSNRLTFMLTATCEFGRYDEPQRTSGAEAALLNAQGGAAGLLTTTRPVYSTGNRVLNRNFFEYAFTPVKGAMPRLGDLVMRTKNSSILDTVSGSRGVNNRNFTLLGDPTMQLAYATLQAEITHINGKATSSDTLSALGKVTMAGRILAASGETKQSFNGELQLTVYEKTTTVKTLGDEGAPSVPISLRQNILYEGKATVKNGLFEVTFIVPKDIVYTYGPGKITLYASNSTIDAMGASQSVIVGGTAQAVTTDNTPPAIKLYMDDESFVFGGSTNSNPTLLAKVADESGINTAGVGVGHEITVVLDNEQDNLIVVNDYYTSDADSYQSGTIKFPLQDLAPGPHSVKLKAWDTYNNSSEEYLELYVSNEAEIALEHVLNHPNPFSTKTTFHFDHNRAGDNLDIQVQIFTISGKLVRTLETTSYASKAHLAELTWDGRDEYNDILAKGVYVYKVNVRSQQDGSKTSRFEKLVILN